jgi:hypothetical protein
MRVSLNVGPAVALPLAIEAARRQMLATLTTRAGA